MSFRLNSGCFKKGIIPWNKGIKLPQFSGKNHPKYGKKNSIETRIKIGNSNRGKKRSISTKLKMSLSAPKGEKHHAWIKDRTKLKKDPRKDLDTQYKYWMRNVKQRDGWKCRLLNSDCSGKLESHHILSWREYPTLRYVINNGIALCHFHHPRGGKEEKRMIPIFQELLSVSKD